MSRQNIHQALELYQLQLAGDHLHHVKQQWQTKFHQLVHSSWISTIDLPIRRWNLSVYYLQVFRKKNKVLCLYSDWYLFYTNQCHIVHNATYRKTEMDTATALWWGIQSLQEDPFQESAELDCLKPHSLLCTLLRAASKRDVLQSYHNHNQHPGSSSPA